QTARVLLRGRGEEVRALLLVPGGEGEVGGQEIGPGTRRCLARATQEIAGAAQRRRIGRGAGVGKNRARLRDERVGIRRAAPDDGDFGGSGGLLERRPQSRREDRLEDHVYFSSRTESPSLLKRRRTARASLRDPVMSSAMRSKSPPASRKSARSADR